MLTHHPSTDDAMFTQHPSTGVAMDAAARNRYFDCDCDAAARNQYFDCDAAARNRGCCGCDGDTATRNRKCGGTADYATGPSLTNDLCSFNLLCSRGERVMHIVFLARHQPEQFVDTTISPLIRSRPPNHWG